MGIEDDPLLNPPGPQPDPRGLERAPPYHEMTADERRAAWAALREEQKRRARRHGFAPTVFTGFAVALFVAMGVLYHYGEVGWAKTALWTAVGFTGFAAIAYVRRLMGGLAGRRQDLSPPGF